jgi:hypothetical protein
VEIMSKKQMIQYPRMEKLKHYVKGSLMPDRVNL